VSVNRSDTIPDGQPILEARELIAGYVEDICILNGISVRAWPGRIACVLGPNGTGKSTLLKTIFGFLRPLSGSVLYAGADITGTAPYAMMARGITYLPQQPSLFPYLSVEVNLRLGLWHAKVERAALRAKIDRAFERFPVLRERARLPADYLSGGQQRQLEVARSYLSDPKVYLIDEPTAGIDPITSREIYRVIRGLASEEGRAILLVDQDVRRALEIADYVYVVRNGALFAEGPRESFKGNIEDLVSHWLHADTRGPSTH
jgi:branched-chain amino acid transport system ATP-binding protein